LDLTIAMLRPQDTRTTPDDAEAACQCNQVGKSRYDADSSGVVDFSEWDHTAAIIHDGYAVLKGR